MGGGFGAEGALRGMAIAGAVNLLTGALSSAAAAGQRNAARQSAAADLKKPGNLRKIIDAFEQLVDQGLWLTARLIASRKSDALEFPSEDDVRQARALLSNLSIPPATRALFTLAPSLVMTNDGSNSPVPISVSDASEYSCASILIAVWRGDLRDSITLPLPIFQWPSLLPLTRTYHRLEHCRPVALPLGHL